MNDCTRGGPTGVGVGVRFEHWAELERASRRIDWLELIPENFIGQGGWRRRMLDGARTRWPIAVHGVSLSIGGPDALDPGYLAALKGLLDELEVATYSDHLCWSSAFGTQYFDLLPLPFTEEAVRWAAGRVRRVSELLERPVLLENIAYYAKMPGGTLSEGEFVSAVLAESDAFLLLDVSNAYVNAINHGHDPIETLSALPLERTRQIHLGSYEPDPQGVLLDHHGARVSSESWALFRQAIRRVGEVSVSIEWDANLPSLDRLLDQADLARQIMNETLAGVA